MNNADRKLIREFLSTVAEFGTLPDAKSDFEKRTELESRRLLMLANHAEWVASDDENMTRRMRSLIEFMREDMAKPVPYEVAPPEYADLCVCGQPRSSHIGLTGKYVLALTHSDKYICPGFTLATDERKTA